MPNKLRVFTKGLVLIATFLAVGWLLKVSGLRLDESWVDAEIRGQGLHGEAVYILVSAIMVAVGLPRQGISFLGGYAFGFWIGGGLALIASIIGSVATFLYARFMGRDFVQRRFGERVAKFDGILAQHPFSTTLLIRLLPVGNNLLTNMVAAVSSARAVPFFIGSAIGFVPQTAVFSLLGSGFQVDPLMKTLLAVALFVASAVLGLYLYRTFKAERGLDRVVQSGPGDIPPAQ